MKAIEVAAFVKELAAALPEVLDDITELGARLSARTAELRAALGQIPQTSEYASILAQLAWPLAQCDLVTAVIDGAPTSNLQDLVLELERARKRAKKGK